MFEKLKIRYFGHQPVAKISNKTLDKIVQREYSDSIKEVRQKLVLISSNTLKGRNRLSVAVLKLSNGDFSKIDLYIEICNNDFRDVVTQAEYPRSSKFGFQVIDPNELKKLYLEDWTEYSSWVNKERLV